MNLLLLPVMIVVGVLNVIWQIILLPFALLYAFTSFLYLGIMMMLAGFKKE